MSSPEDILFTSSANRVNYVPRSNAADQQKSTPLSADKNYSEEEQTVIDELKRRDAEVRKHEQAHLSAAGAYATGAASFVYQQGPDGKNYAIGGEVRIDTSPVNGDPDATLRKAEQVKRAALAPATPSGQDRAVAAQAATLAVKARIELSKQQTEPEQPAPELQSVAQGNDQSAAESQITPPDNYPDSVGYSLVSELQLPTNTELAPSFKATA